VEEIRAPTAPARAPTAPARGHPARGIIVAIDGPSGSGKSTVAREVARRLRLRYLDTGAMYRAVTWHALEWRADLDDPAALGELAVGVSLQISTDPGDFWIVVEGRDATEAIRTRPVTNAVSVVSAVQAVRHRLLRLQRDLIGAGSIVVEGRDIGTVVAPDAHVKVFLTASSTARANRRSRELDGPAESRAAAEAAMSQTRAEIDRRDKLDSSRAAGPLAKAADAVELDSTAMTAEEVVDEVLRMCNEVTGSQALPVFGR